MATTSAWPTSCEFVRPGLYADCMAGIANQYQLLLLRRLDAGALEGYNSLGDVYPGRRGSSERYPLKAAGGPGDQLQQVRRRRLHLTINYCEAAAAEAAAATGAAAGSGRRVTGAKIRPSAAFHRCRSQVDYLNLGGSSSTSTSRPPSPGPRTRLNPGEADRTGRGRAAPRGRGDRPWFAVEPAITPST